LDIPELESRISDIERRLSKLEAALQGTGSTALQSSALEAKLVQNAEKLKTQEMIIVSLKLNGKQSKEQIKKTLQDWGKVYGNWFEGGNFNGRLVKKNIVKKEEAKNEKNEDLFSLTKRGEMMAEELIAKANAD
jgi:hypothetical protein